MRNGERASQEVMLFNSGKTPVYVRPLWSDWQLDENGSVTLIPPGSIAQSLDSTVKIEPRELSFQPGESPAIHVTTSVPFGGQRTRWGLLLSEVRPAVIPADSRGPCAVALLGTTFYLSTVPADSIAPELLIGETSLDWQKSWTNPSAQAADAY